MTQFRSMRLSSRQLPQSEALSLLATCNVGVLSVCGDDGYPYGVPVNYAFADGRFYIHSTCRESHKLDAIRRCPKVSMTVISREMLDESALTTRYASVIAFGTAQILTQEPEKRAAAEKLMRHLAPGMGKDALASCSHLSNIVMIEITPEHITGKGC